MERTSASVELAFPSERDACVVYSALKPEEFLPESVKCKASLSCRRNVLRLQIYAKDTAALRAALNSFLRWAAVARDMIEVGRN